VIQCQIRHHMLQLSVLVLQLLQLLGFTAVHPTVLRLPAVVRLLRDPVLPAQLRCCQSCLALLQDRDDLLFAVSRAFHCGSPLLVWENSHSRWSGFRGLGQDNVIYADSLVLFFESESQIDSWAKRHNIARGDSQPAQRVYELGATWYAHHLDKNWHKWTLEEARAIFTKCGLAGPIWDLPHSDERF